MYLRVRWADGDIYLAKSDLTFDLDFGLVCAISNNGECYFHDIHIDGLCTFAKSSFFTKLKQFISNSCYKNNPQQTQNFV